MLFVPGEIYHRKTDLHKIYKGQPQGGISTPKDYNLIFVFTGDSGKNYGYDQHDGWQENVFYLTGEGQKGEQQYTKGNLAIKNHLALQKDIHLFSYTGMKSGYVQYVNQMVCIGSERKTATDIDNKERKVIVFELIPINSLIRDVDISSNLSLKELKDRLSVDILPESKYSVRFQIYYQRSQNIKAYALKRADGICEGCKSPAPFKTKKNQPFLEVHHLFRLSDGGPDHIDAVIALVAPSLT